jgi:hypothetical protein
MVKKIKDAADIIDNYNTITEEQALNGYQGQIKQKKTKKSKKDFSESEKQLLDNIPDLMPSKNLSAQDRLKQYRNSREKPDKIIIPPEYEDIPISQPNTPITYDKEIVKDNSKAVSDFVKPKESHQPTIVPQNQVVNPPMDESGDIDLNKLFSSEVGSESDVVKELFSSENIKVKTELNANEISIISRLELQASMTQNFYLIKVLKELETLRVSKDRKSRSEFVNSFRGIGEQNSGMNAFSKLGNIFKNDKV